ncbi:unnamed protein product [Arctogadus glacialis]
MAPRSVLRESVFTGSHGRVRAEGGAGGGMTRVGRRPRSDLSRTDRKSGDRRSRQRLRVLTRLTASDPEVVLVRCRRVWGLINVRGHLSLGRNAPGRAGYRYAPPLRPRPSETPGPRPHLQVLSSRVSRERFLWVTPVPLVPLGDPRLGSSPGTVWSSVVGGPPFPSRRRRNGISGRPSEGRVAVGAPGHRALDYRRLSSSPQTESGVGGQLETIQEVNPYCGHANIPETRPPLFLIGPSRASPLSLLVPSMD